MDFNRYCCEIERCHNELVDQIRAKLAFLGKNFRLKSDGHF